ncbi:DUF732 domain-containing protein [Mycobacterium sp. 29Ha]|uniref:DUF732 domain-containing protein n=1 Tax=Mycobacterium sp. 29Ha TaxID=2939268 RepID=UPI0039779821
MFRLVVAAKITTACLVGVLGSGLASASPPEQGGPGSDCGAHDSAIVCASTGSPTPGEDAFIERARGYFPGSDVQLLKIGRGTCYLVRQGEVTTNSMVADIAEYTGMSEERAGQVLAVAMDTACPGFTVAGNGTTLPK